MRQGHSIELAGRRVELGRWGSGPPVVLVHGSGVGAVQWRRLTKQLAPRWQVLVPSLLGYGGTPWDRDAPFDHADDQAVVSAVLATLPAPAHLVGHSYGALLALRIAMTEPEAVASLAVYEPVLVHALEAATGRLNRTRAIADAPTAQSDETYLERFVDYWTGRGGWRALPARQRGIYLERAVKIRAEVRSSLADPTDARALGAIRAPTLVMSGSDSPADARRMSELAVTAIAGARRRVLVGAGHMGPVTHAAQVGEAVEAHLSRQPRAAAPTPAQKR